MIIKYFHTKIMAAHQDIMELAENLYELKHKPSIMAGFHLNEHLKEIKYKNIVTGKKYCFQKLLTNQTN